MNFPDWVPEGLANTEFCTLLEGEARDTLVSNMRKLLRNPRMEEVWRTIKRHANKPDWDIEFVEQVLRLLEGPPRFDALSKLEIVEKGKRIISAARKVQAMLNDIGLDYSVWNLCSDEDYMQEYSRLITVENELIERISNIDILLTWRTIVHHYKGIVHKNITELLAKLEKEIEQAIQRERILARPSHESARLHHFVRRLTRYMRQEFGQPLRQAVADTATVVLDLPKSLTKEDITRLAP